MGKIAPLARSVLGKGLDLSEISILAAYFTVRSVKAGEALFSEGDAGQSLFFVCDGEVVLKKERGPGAGEELRLASGDILGELSLLQGTQRLVSAIAANKGKMLVLEREAFVNLGREAPVTHAKFSRNLLQIVRGKCEGMGLN